MRAWKSCLFDDDEDMRMMTTTATSIRKRESESNGKNVQLSLTHINIYTRIYLQSIKFLLNY